MRIIFDVRTPLERLLRFAGPALIDQALVSGTNFAMAIVLARILGIAAFGQFSLVLVIIFFCLQIQQALITAPMMTLSARSGEKGYFSRLVPLQLILTVLLAVGAW